MMFENKKQKKSKNETTEYIMLWFLSFLSISTIISVMPYFLYGVGFTPRVFVYGFLASTAVVLIIWKFDHKVYHGKMTGKVRK